MSHLGHIRAEKSDLVFLDFRLELRPCQFPSHYILPAGIVKRTKEIFSCSTFLHFLLVFIFLSIFVISSKYFPSLRPQLSLSTKKEPREQRKMLIEETIFQNRKYYNNQPENIRYKSLAECWLGWCCCTSVSMNDLQHSWPGDHPALLPACLPDWGWYPGIMRYKHSLHHQPPRYWGPRIPSGLAWPDSFESEGGQGAADHYKSNRPSLDWKPERNAVFKFVDIRGPEGLEEVQWLTVSWWSLTVVELQTGWSPGYPVIEFVMRTPALLSSPSWPWSNDTLSPDPAS